MGVRSHRSPRNSNQPFHFIRYHNTARFGRTRKFPYASYFLKWCSIDFTTTRKTTKPLTAAHVSPICARSPKVITHAMAAPTPAMEIPAIRSSLPWMLFNCFRISSCEPESDIFASNGLGPALSAAWDSPQPCPWACEVEPLPTLYPPCRQGTDIRILNTNTKTNTKTETDRGYPRGKGLRNVEPALRSGYSRLAILRRAHTGE